MKTILSDGWKKLVLKYKLPVLLCLVAACYVVSMLLTLTIPAGFDYLHLVSRLGVAVLLLITIFVLQKIRQSPGVYFLLTSGFGSLFLALSAEIFTEWQGAVSAPFIVPAVDLLQLLGFALVIAGIYQWITYSDQVYDRLNKLAITDSLTGLLNRRAFLERAELELERSRRHKRELAIIMIDIDHFKSINDSFGHVCGDAVLKKFSSEATAILRKTDIITRWGGEEFLVLVPESGKDKCEAVAEKLRAHTEKISIVAGKADISITISLGATVLVPESDSIDTMIARADAQLYEAKRSGKNCVRIKI